MQYYRLPNDEVKVLSSDNFVSTMHRGLTSANLIKLLNVKVLTDTTGTRNAKYVVMLVDNITLNQFEVVIGYGKATASPTQKMSRTRIYTSTDYTNIYKDVVKHFDALAMAKLSKNYVQIMEAMPASSQVIQSQNTFYPSSKLPSSLHSKILAKHISYFKETGTDAFEYYPQESRIMVMSMNESGIAVYNATEYLHDVIEYSSVDLFDPTPEILQEFSQTPAYFYCYLTDVSTYRLLSVCKPVNIKNNQTWDQQKSVIEYVVESLLDKDLSIYDKFSPINVNPYELFSEDVLSPTMQPDDSNARILAKIQGRVPKDYLYLSILGG